MSTPPPIADVLVVGAGAAGLMAGIWASRSGSGRVVLLDGARKPGAKILVAGGGRCNVTHHAVDEGAYAGASRNAIRRVLRRFDVARTTAFFADLGVTLKLEETGKLFPATDRAQTVLDALHGALHDAGGTLHHPHRVETIERRGEAFVVRGSWGAVEAARVVLATGGRSLPKSGSDGHGYVLARGLGHTVTPRIFPALVPLTLPAGHPLLALSGLATEATLEVRAASGRRLAAFTGSTLCTHFGLSGPAPMDLSRYLLDARHDDPGATLLANWLPDTTPDAFDRTLRELGPTTVGRHLRERLPTRLADILLEAAGVDPAVTGAVLTRDDRRALVHTVTGWTLPVTGHRGYNHAEVTAGGVPLDECSLKTLESRACPGLHLCGEILDVDGRIGGFNFQWAWASGFVAGTAAGTAVGTAADGAAPAGHRPERAG